MPAFDPIPRFDLYAELEVAPSASPAAIDAAWRSLVKRHHPDALLSASDAGYAASRIRRLNVAHDWLADPNRRARYDAERALRPDVTLRRPARSPVYAPPPAAAPRGARGAPPEWSRVPPPAGVDLRSVMSSPAFAVALVVILGAIAVGAALTLFGVLTDASPVSDEAPTLEGGGVTSDPASSPLPDDADALAATIPDQVDGLILLGESGSGVDVFGADASGVDELASRAGGQPDGVRAAYKAGATPDGEVVLSVIALSVESVAGTDLAAQFRRMSEEDLNAAVSWSDGTAGGRPVAVSRDAEDPETVAYLLGSGDAMYLVVSSDEALAGEAVRSLP